MQDQYGEAVTGKTATWEYKAGSADAKTDTKVGDDKKLAVAADETVGNLTVTAKCDDLETDTRTVAVTKATDPGTKNPTITALTVAPTSVSLSSSDTADKEVTITLKGSNFDATGAKPVTLSYTLKDDKGQAVTKGTNTGFVSGSSVAETLEVAAADINTTGKEVKFKIDKAQASATLEITATYDGTAFATKPTVAITLGGGSGDTNTAISSFALTGLSASGLKVGETVPTLATSAEKCTIEDVTWTKESASDTITAGTSKFGAGTYKAVVVVETTNTKGFADAVTDAITFGDNLGDIVTLGTGDDAPVLTASGSDSNVKDTLTFTLNITVEKEKLTELAITGLSEPETGSTSITEADVKLSPENETKYSIKTKPSSWTEADGTYTADITFEITGDAANNYVFDTKSVELNAGTFAKGAANAAIKGTATETEVTFTITYTPTSPSSGSVEE